MRLSADQVREGLFHPDEGVRRLAFNYFTDSHTTDTAVTATVLEGIARFGLNEFVVNFYGFVELPHTPESVRWVVDRLTATDQSRGTSAFSGILSSALFECPFELLAPHEATIPALRVGADWQAKLRRRRELHESPDDAVWERLTAVCADLDADDAPWDSPGIDEGEELERTAGDRPGLAPRVLEWVNALAPDKFRYLDMFAIRLAGRLRLAAAVPALARYAGVCDELWHEDLEPALCRIGSDECLPLFRELWAGDNGDFRYTAARVMGTLHTDASVAACLELAASFHDPYKPDGMAHILLESAARSFDTAAVEPTRQFLLKLPTGWNRRTMYERDIRGSLIDACTLTGERFPEYDQWRRDEIEATAAVNRRVAGLEPFLPLNDFDDEPHPVSPRASAVFDRYTPPPPPVIVGKAAAGRNDPCPCKSGKKFKKCCGK